MSSTTQQAKGVRSSNPGSSSSSDIKKATEDQTVAQLRAVAKDRGYVGYTKLTKASLIDFINSEGSSNTIETDEKKPAQVKVSRETVRETPPATITIERQKPSVAPKVAPKVNTHEHKPTLKDLLPRDHPIEKVNRSIQKDYTPEFLALKKEGVSTYIRMTQLGKPGKEGTVYLVAEPESNKRYAMKTFRKKKSGRTLEKEAFYQHLAAKQGISPRVIEYNPEEKYIVMDILNQTLLDIIKTQGTLTADQQRQILDIYRRLDSIGIMLNDANPLNIMEKGGRFYAIDYGFAKFSDHKDFKDYPYPNYQLMPLGLILWLKERHPTKSWTIIRDAISPEVRLKMNVDEWP